MCLSAVRVYVPVCCSCVCACLLLVLFGHVIRCQIDGKVDIAHRCLMPDSIVNLAVSLPILMSQLLVSLCELSMSL